MVERTSDQAAIECLQQLGLKEYEAKCFTALIQVEKATARDVSDRIDVPRTRVYEAARVLEEKGLIEIQHGSPKQYRAIKYREALDVLKKQYQTRFNELEENLTELDANRSPVNTDAVPQEIWSITGRAPIQSRTNTLIDEAINEIVLVIGREEILFDDLHARLTAAHEDDITIFVGVANNEIKQAFLENTPDIEIYESELPWLQTEADVPTVGRILLVDAENILVSTVIDHDNGEIEEHGVFGTGFQNSLIAVARRMLMVGDIVSLPGQEK